MIVKKCVFLGPRHQMKWTNIIHSSDFICELWPSICGTLTNIIVCASVSTSKSLYLLDCLPLSFPILFNMFLFSTLNCLTHNFGYILYTYVCMLKENLKVCIYIFCSVSVPFTSCILCDLCVPLWNSFETWFPTGLRKLEFGIYISEKLCMKCMYLYVHTHTHIGKENKKYFPIYCHVYIFRLANIDKQN